RAGSCRPPSSINDRSRCHGAVVSSTHCNAIQMRLTSGTRIESDRTALPARLAFTANIVGRIVRQGARAGGRLERFGAVLIRLMGLPRRLCLNVLFEALDSRSGYSCLSGMIEPRLAFGALEDVVTETMLEGV